MKRILGFTAAGLALLAIAAVRLRAQQEWAPPSRDMPEMPASSALGGGWRASLASWFSGTGQALDGIRAVGDGGVVRFMGNARPVATWSDRNGDRRADMIEIYRNGALAYQLIDADYDGRANVLRVYDASGNLVSENRL
ncbi:MAG TPA: hypothetical protein VFQ45_06700 [Longimicrobium sp.]|nr:hypothetical protein [Longimicrobium sp.]